MVRQFQFVAVSYGTESPSSESKRLAYSHAFRQAHAQRRREQVKAYKRKLASVPVNKAFTASEGAVSSSLSQVLNSNKDPFSSLARPLSSVEYFLLNHCMSVMILFPARSMGEDAPQDQQVLGPLADIALITDVHVIVPFTVGHCGLFDYPGDHKTQLLQEWVGLAITDDALMIAAILLSTCRYILQVQPGNLIFVQLALQYKQICLQTLRHEMDNTSGPVTIMTIAKALALAVDEVTAGEHTIARKHLKGVLAMVTFSGGAGVLGLTGLLERMYRRFLRALELEDPEIDLLCSKTLTHG